MKKQLLGPKTKRRKKMQSRRQRRSFFPYLLNPDWIFGLSEGKNEKKEKERPPDNQSKVVTLLDIARKRAKDTPIDFFQVVTSSDIKHSLFSGHQTSTIVNKSSLISNKANESKDNKNRKRNYKRQKMLFNSPHSQSWAGTFTNSAGSSCPAYLVTPSHVVTSGACAHRTVTASLSVIFSVYRVAVTRVTLHCGMSDGCDLAMLTLHSPLPHGVGLLCYPADYVGTLLGISTGDSARDWMVQAIKEKPYAVS